MKKFKILNREIALDAPYCPVEKQRVELPNGEQTDWWVNTSADAIIVIPVLKDGRILYQKNYKHGSGECILEFCAGMIDPGEKPAESAKRELLEETGHEAKKWISLGHNFSNPTGSQMRYHYFLALECSQVTTPNLEPAEQIECLIAQDLLELSNILCATPLTSSATICALKYAEKYLE